MPASKITHKREICSRMFIGRAAHYISGLACFSLKVPADYGAFYRLIKRHVILAYTRVYSRFPVRVLRPWMDFARIRRPPDGCTPTQLDLCARYRCVGVSAAMQRVSMDEQLARHLLRTIEPQQERLRLRLRAIQRVRKPTYERRKRLAASRRNRSKTRKSKSKKGVKSPKKPPLVHDAGAGRVLGNGL